jgi:hypothetical protein
VLIAIQDSLSAKQPSVLLLPKLHTLLQLGVSYHSRYSISRYTDDCQTRELTIDITLIRHCRHMNTLIFYILQHIRFVPRTSLFLFLIHFRMDSSEHDIERDLVVSWSYYQRAELTNAARPPRTPPMIAPTGGFELSTAAPGGFGSVPLLKGPAGRMVIEDGPALELATTGIGSGADTGTGDGEAGGLPFPLKISYVSHWERTNINCVFPSSPQATHLSTTKPVCPPGPPSSAWIVKVC